MCRDQDSKRELYRGKTCGKTSEAARATRSYTTTKKNVRLGANNVPTQALKGHTSILR